MIRYYAYYNHGGYKDFYLGSFLDEEDFKYFLPLLSIHEQSLIDHPNEILRKEVERQKLLAKLVVLSDTTIEYNYPSAARTLMSHSGYKLLLRQYASNTHVLAIRDIPGSVDSYGRRTPFNMMFIGDNEEDVQSLDILSEYVRCNLSTFETFLNTIFENDLIENGLKVHLKELNAELNRIISEKQFNRKEDITNKSVRMVIIPTGMSLSNCLHEQNISKYNLAVCYDTNGQQIFKAEQPQELPRNPRSSELKDRGTNFHRGGSDPSNPSLHAMLNVPKREEIQKLWDYIYKLEKRIEQLENER